MVTKKIIALILFFSSLCHAQKEILADSILRKKVDSLTYVVADLWNIDLDAAEAKANYMLSYSKKHNFKRGEAQGYSALAGVYSYKGEQGKSIAYYIKAARMFEKVDNQTLLAIINLNIAQGLLIQEEYDEATLYAQKALSFFVKTNREKSLPYTYSVLGGIYIATQKAHDKITNVLNKGLEIVVKRKDTLNICVILNLQSVADLNNNKNLDENVARLNRVLRLIKIKQSDNYFIIGESYHNLGKAYWKIGHLNKALIYNDSALIAYNSLKFKLGLKQTYEMRKNILASQGNYKESLEAYTNFLIYKDSIFQKQRTNQIARIKTEFETDHIRAEKEKAEAQVELAEAVSKQNRNLFYGFLLLIGLAGMASLFFFGRVKARKRAELVTIELRETQKRLALEKQYRDSELKALKAQMNPHFIFNALNSIQEYIILNQKNLAGNYLGKFADLMRKYLHHSDAGFIAIQEEIESLEMYLELEALRFEDTLTYTVAIDESINNDAIKIPTMLVQPYVENALKHGLLHRKENRKLEVTFTQEQGDAILCVIEDNGVGRKLLNYDKDKKIGVIIEDLLHEDGTPKGTKVILQIPTLKN